ncbi:MAG: hypothetical protein LC541_14775 [Candidatus Thiodiazotropha sp.]|nr:hypothetical protein [Candidatus Thiodiazotropha sp.]MCM8884534.1 hypothetical protein [Candidatus Thiodiazotropha sp.]
MTGRRVRMLALHPLWRKARRVYSLASRLPGTNRLGFQPSLALSDGKSQKKVASWSVARPNISAFSVVLQSPCVKVIALER